MKKGPVGKYKSVLYTKRVRNMSGAMQSPYIYNLYKYLSKDITRVISIIGH